MPPEEFTNPAYINPAIPADDNSGSGFSVIQVANQAARLALPLATAAASAVIQSDDSSVWGLKPNGAPSLVADWLRVGSAALPGTLASQSAANVNITGGNLTGVTLGTITFSNAAAARTALGLGAVNNTADADKPVSTAQAAALADKAPLASPALTGTPTAPTAAGGTNNTQLATTAFVAAAVAPKAPLASPALTGTPTAPTAAGGTTTTQLATTAFVAAAVAPKAPLASPALTGVPTAPTAAGGTATTQLATTAFVAEALDDQRHLIADIDGLDQALAYFPRAIAVTGELTYMSSPRKFGPMVWAGMSAGKVAYTHDGAPPNGSGHECYWGTELVAEGAWSLNFGSNVNARWYSNATVATPDLVPAGPWDEVNNPQGWRPIGLTVGTPAVVSADVVTAATVEAAGRETFAPLAHTHQAAEVEGLADALAALPAASSRPLVREIGDDIFVDAAATLTLGEGNAALTLNANQAGVAGNAISGEILAPIPGADTAVAVAGTAITIQPGASARVLVSGVSAPAINGLLTKVTGDVYGTVPALPKWSTNGQPTKPVSGIWAMLYPWAFVTPASATLAEILPVENYVASAAQSTAPEVQWYDWTSHSWKLYWLFNGNAPTRWIDAGVTGSASCNATVIPAGARLIFLNAARQVTENLSGGLGATWLAAPDAQHEYFLTTATNNVAGGYWRGTAVNPWSVASWIVGGSAVGTPVINAVASSSGQAAAAIQNSAPAAALVGAAAGGDGTGVLLAAAATHLAGGSSVPVPGFPGQLLIQRKADTYPDVYICTETNPILWDLLKAGTPL